MTHRLSCLLLLLAACAAAPAGVPEPRPVYPPPPDPPRVQFLMSLSGSAEVESGPTALDQFLFGRSAEVEKPIMRPVGVAIRDGLVYVLDAQLLLIHRIDLRRQTLDFIVPDGRAQLRLPMDLHLGADGNAYIADRGRKQVLVFDRDWHLLRELGPWSQESAPVAAVTWRDRVLVADVGDRLVRAVDAATGKQLAVLAEVPDHPESAIRAPTGLAVDGSGYLYVVDAVYQRVLAFDKDLAFVCRIGESGDAPGFFGRPKAVAVVDRTLMVVDSLYENCQILDLAGKPLLFFGGGGVGPGDLYLPRGIWVGDDGLALIQDKLEPGFIAEKLIAITSFHGPRKVSLYALGHSDLPAFRAAYPHVELPERPMPSAAAAPTAGAGGEAPNGGAPKRGQQD